MLNIEMHHTEMPKFISTFSMDFVSAMNFDFDLNGNVIFSQRIVCIQWNL